ncbi:MAG: glycosyltransferase [Candidatus Krumholzibacteriia bacterium]
MDVSVIIVSYNSCSVLEPCLESLKRQSVFANMEVIVVDNASADGTATKVREKNPWVRLISCKENLGFSRGMNTGIRESRGRYFLILNPDTVLREEAIEKLLGFMESTPDAGIVGPRMVFHDGNLQYSCRRFYNWKVLLLRRTFLGKIFRRSKSVADHLMLDFDHESTRQVDWVLGACMLVRRKAVQSVGLLDERFFLYFEDVDWCYRMRQKGWGVYYNPHAVVVHDYARESAHSVINRTFVLHLASLIRYYEKWSFVLYFLKRYREAVKILLFLAVDVIAFNLAFLSAYYLRVIASDVFPNPIFPVGAYGGFVVFENLLFVFTYFASGLYRVRRDTTGVDELFDIGRAIVLASVLLMASTYLGQIRTYSRMVVTFLAAFSILYDWGLRSAIRAAHRRLIAQKIDLKRVCIVGPPAGARELEVALSNEAALGMDVVGIVGTGADEDGGAGRSLGGLAELGEIIDRFRVQELIFLHDAVPSERLAEFVMLGRRQVVDVSVVTDYSGLVIQQATVGDLAGRPVIAYPRDTRYALDRAAKRLLDVVLAAVFLLVSALFFVVYSLYAMVRGRMPFSRDERLGLGGKPFILPLAGTRSTNGPSDIVNLPLFWLVLVGRMSMVGPYPLPSRDAELLETAAGFRFDVRPGVTGYWRVGGNSNVSVEKLLAQDANYTRNWSFAADLKLLVVTSGNLVLGKNRRLDIESATRQ